MRHVFLTAAVVSSMVLAGCAGRAANPVMIQQYGDNSKSCEALDLEMANIETEVNRLIPKSDKTGQNVALGTAGAFLLVPLLFMDFSQAEQIEINAYRQRYNHLAIITMEKGCESNRKPILEEPESDQAEPITEDSAA